MCRVEWYVTVFHANTPLDTLTGFSKHRQPNFTKLLCFGANEIFSRMEAKDAVCDLPISVLTFGGGNAPPEDGIYFVIACMITAATGDDTTSELYCVDASLLTDECVLQPVFVSLQDMRPIDC